MSSTATARNLVGPLVRMGYRIRVTGAHHCPRTGPLLVVAPYTGVLDPTVIASCLPRPVDVLVDPGALSSWGAHVPGRIVVGGDDPGPALRAAREILAAGGAVGAWTGEGRERAAGYLLAGTGAPVMAVAVLGDRDRHPGNPPRWRSRVDVVMSEPVIWEPVPDAVSRLAVLQLAETIRQSVADHAAAARVRAGLVDGVVVDPVRAAPDNGAS